MPVLLALLEARPPVDRDFRLDTDATLPSLEVQVLDEGAVVDLTGATVLFSMEDLAGTPKITGAAAVLQDALNGIVRYDWDAADVDTTGIYIGQFQITTANGVYLQPNNATERLRILIGPVDAPSVLPLPSTILHAPNHMDGGVDELPVDTLAESAIPGNDVSEALRPDGSGGVEFRDVDHSELAGITADQHHNEDHASRHIAGAVDELSADTLAEAVAPSNDVSRALRPDGFGGVEFRDVDADEVAVDVTNFDKRLSPIDSDVQKALDALDDAPTIIRRLILANLTIPSGCTVVQHDPEIADGVGVTIEDTGELLLI